MEIVDDPSLGQAREIIAASRQKRLDVVIHTVLDETVARDQMPDRTLSPLELPSPFLTSPMMDNFVDSDPDLAATLKEFLRRTTYAFSLPDIPGHSAKDFQPSPCAAQIMPNSTTALPPGIQCYTWKSMQHASLGISMLTSHLHGCNIAGMFAQKANAKVPAATTAEYQEMAKKAFQEISIIVGSIPYLLSSGGSDNDDNTSAYMSAHNMVPLVVALESPFATTVQQECIVNALEYSINNHGIRQSKAILDHWRQFQKNSTSKCSSNNIRQTDNFRQIVTTC